MGKVARAAVKIRENESFESLLSRFKKTVNKYGILSEVRKRNFYISPSEARHIADLKRVRKQRREELKRRRRRSKRR